MSETARIVERFERADLDELPRLFNRLSVAEEGALRAYLGDARFERIARLTRPASVSRGPAGGASLGNVIVIHGIMGAELSATDTSGAVQKIWVNYWSMARGHMSRLRLRPDGLDEVDERYSGSATAILKKYYAETLLSLSQRYRVRPFFFDWRLDIDRSADELDNFIRAKFPDRDGNGDRVHIVAHSMGGLVARTFIKRHPDRWGNMSGADKKHPGRLIMLGTPNRGSFVIPQIITGFEPVVRQLAALGSVAAFGFSRSLDRLLDVINSFPGSYQMLPSPEKDKSLGKLYESGTYGDRNVPQLHLNAARQHHEWLGDLKDDGRMTYVAGYDQLTYNGVTDYGKLGEAAGYTATRLGDGRVPHALGLLEGTPTYYVRESHGSLPVNAAVLEALPDLLEKGETRVLGTTLPSGLRAGKPEDGKALALQLAERQKADVEETERLIRQADLNRHRRTAAAAVTRALYRDAAAGRPAPLALPTPAPLSTDPAAGTGSEAVGNVDPVVGGADGVTGAAGPAPQEQFRVEDQILCGFLPAGSGDAGADGGTAAGIASDAEAATRLVAVTIAVKVGGIERLPEDVDADAVAVGNYVGVRPQDAIFALDCSISRQLPGDAQTPPRKGRDHLLITQYVERGVIRGELGQTFLIPDPRPGAKPGAVIAIAGMGLPGRFGSSELVVMARELCWALGRLGRKHLACVLVGSGTGSLSVADAVQGWLEGIHAAVRSHSDEQHGRLERVTFIEYDPHRAPKIHNALAAAVGRMAKAGLKITCGAPPPPPPQPPSRPTHQTERRSSSSSVAPVPAGAEDTGRAETGRDDVPNRITFTRERDAYRFGAITENASIPEREVVVDPALISEINDLVVTEPRNSRQLEYGQLLAKLLIPRELNSEFHGDRPLVMLLDATTARVHWELAARSDLEPSAAADGAPDRNTQLRHFFGIGEGFTRQLRTTFAPPPEAPPPARRVLRVLVVADPAADAPLPGAQQEGEAVARLFESYNARSGSRHGNRVQVTALIGPSQATRVRVLKELLVSKPGYDVLHFAGHCFFDEQEPSRSGWIFSHGARLSADELNRIDRVPAFVFSNACESGITPDRSAGRSAGMAPSFAESFFGRGVSNFVCTAWPVDDVAAREFATCLYSNLLGLHEAPPPGAGNGAGPRDGGSVPPPPPPALEPVYMFQAMREARRAIAGTLRGACTWGAYQHYGNPYFRFFSRSDASEADAPPHQESRPPAAGEGGPSTAGVAPPPTAAPAGRSKGSGKGDATSSS